MVTVIQSILIAFAVGVIVGCVIGWKMTFNMRLAKIQEQQVLINRLKADRKKMKSELMEIRVERAKEKVGSAVDVVSDVGKSAASVASTAGKGIGKGVTSVAQGLKTKIFGKKKDDEEPEEQKAIDSSSNGE